MVAGRPAGWPADLPAPGSEEFAERVGGWLLDRGPSYLRGSGLERDLLVLSYVVDRHAQATAQGLRGSYASLRSEVGVALGAAGVEAAQRGIERAGAEATVQAREIGLVREAIAARSPRIEQ